MVSDVRRPSLLIRSLLLGGISAGALVLACGTSGTDPTPPPATTDGGLADRGRLPAPIHLTGRPCDIIVDTPELLASPHVPEGTAITYSSSPPSSGPHFQEWANFQEFNVPLEDGFLVHSLEHGAVELLYGPGATPQDLAALRKIRDSIPTDPICDAAIRVRVVIAPYAKMDVPFAAVAWGWTYKAKCLDAETMGQFAKDHYNHGTEDLCVPGRSF
jgi:Protein of unknown function (DUF3105)